MGDNLSGHIANYVATHRPASAKGTTYSLHRFARAAGDPAPADLTARHVEAWWRSIGHLAPSSLRQQHSLVRCFLAWLRAHGALTGDPLAIISRPNEPRRLPVTLNSAEVDAIRHECSTTRDRAIVELAWGLGLRCVEIARLQIADVDFTGRLVEVHGKGGHVDMLPLPSRVDLALQAYLLEHPAPSGPLLRDLRWHRHPISPAWVSEVVVRLAKRAGVKRSRYDGKTAHGLRRTCATELLDDGATIREVQAVLRHASLSTTERYLRRSSANDLREVLERRAGVA